jgi:hypothetical protein
MIGPCCDKCGVELQEYGAVALSPPETFPDGSCGREVEKFHLCRTCWYEFKEWLVEKDAAT